MNMFDKLLSIFGLRRINNKPRITIELSFNDNVDTRYVLDIGKYIAESIALECYMAMEEYNKNKFN